MLIFSSGDLDDFGFQVTYSFSYLIKIPPHPFVLVPVVSFYLISNDLRVIINDYAFGPCCFGKIKPHHECFVFHLIIGMGKSRWTIHSTMSPSGDSSMMSAPPTCLLDDPFVCILHLGTSSAPLPSSLVNSAIKFVTICPLIVIRGRYWMSNSLSSMAHTAN